MKTKIKSALNYKKPAFWIVIASVLVCAVAGVSFATGKGTKGIENNMAEIVKENAGQKSGTEKWCVRAVAGDCVLLKKETTTSDEDAKAGIFNNTETALKGLESDGEDWSFAFLDDEYAIAANRNRNEDGNLVSEDDETWSKNILKANSSFFIEHLTNGDSEEQSELLTKLQAIENE